ncbi:MAG: hypothetical protein RBS40_11570 [Rhodocyclaceae bacterium]|jgi:hypothetical protein|nr:hypothetical protein [Rhodocyclaceae bacterium]
MADELIELIAVATTDAAIGETAKRHHWAKVVKVLISLIFIGLIVTAVYVIEVHS